MAMRNEPYKATSVFGFVDIEADLFGTFYNHSNEQETTINLDYVLNDIEYEDPLEPETARFLEICRKAKAEGIDTLIAF